jgi:hypothetical protein
VWDSKPVTIIITNMAVPPLPPTPPPGADWQALVRNAAGGPTPHSPGVRLSQHRHSDECGPGGHRQANGAHSRPRPPAQARGRAGGRDYALVADWALLHGHGHGHVLRFVVWI